MTRHGVRFSPPRVEPSAEIAWVLRRAFGPLGPLAGPRPDGPVHDLAARLGLSARIGSRQPRERLAAEVGDSQAARFHRDRDAAAAATLSLHALAEQVTALAAAHSLPVTLLKHGALEALGLLGPGSRAAADLDLLAPRERARELHDLLLARGFRASTLPAMEHQLPALAHASGAVDLHVVVLGVRIGGGRGSATADDLAAAGLLSPAPGFPPGNTVPAREVLAAHALVHGLAQHGYAPHAYPGFRLLADLIDLGLGQEGAPGAAEERGGGAGGALAARAGPLVARDVRPAEVEAARALCQALAAGNLGPLEAEPASSGEAALLHHLLAGALDPAYRRSLRFAMLVRPLSDRSRLAGALGGVRVALLPSRAELEALYGGSGGRLGRLGRRLLRPLDLLARAARYATSAARVRGRRAT